MAARLPQLRVVEVPCVGHVPVSDESVAIDAIGAFLAALLREELP